MCDIHSKEIMAWQNGMLNHHDENGKPYSPVYLKTLHNQLSAVFNHAVRHYGLKVNPAAQVGNMGKAKGREMQFWTKAEYLKFADAMMDKPLSYYAFEMLYWCGVREVSYWRSPPPTSILKGRPSRSPNPISESKAVT